MKKYTKLIDLKIVKGSLVLAVGFFDGVHLGHKNVIEQALKLAEKHKAQTYVLTFKKHPLSIISPEIAPPMLNSNQYKLKLLNRLGVSGCVELDFTPETSKISADEFISQLKDVTPPLVGIVSGKNWRFGHKGLGTPEMLKECNLWDIKNIDHTLYNGHAISSTRIRKAVTEGNLEEASKMLGRPFSMLEKVIAGKRLGRTLGFPTANFRMHDGALPPYGIYAVRVKYRSKVYNGILNIGIRPTLEDSNPANLELNIFDFNQDIYGKNIEMFFIKKIRNEKKFSTIDELTTQIAKDIEVSKKILMNESST